ATRGPARPGTESASATSSSGSSCIQALRRRRRRRGWNTEGRGPIPSPSWHEGSWSVPYRPGHIERSPFDAIVVLPLCGSLLRLLDAEDLVVPDDNPAVIIELDDDLASEDFLGQDPALSTRGNDPRADGRQFALEGLVGIELVTQAAFKPTTAP